MARCGPRFHFLCDNNIVFVHLSFLILGTESVPELGTLHTFPSKACEQKRPNYETSPTTD